MRSLKQIHLDELESTNGVASGLEIRYARFLARSAADRYERNFGIFEDTRLRDETTFRFLVGHSDGFHNELVEVVARATKVGEIQVSGQPAEDILQDADGELSLVTQPRFPEYERRVADDRRAQSPVEFARKVLGVEVTEAQERVLHALPKGIERQAVAPFFRRSRFILVGTYELVIPTERDGNGEIQPQYKRLQLTSVPREIKGSVSMSNQLTDALNTVAFMEHGLDPAAVFSVIDADVFEAEYAGRLI